MRLNTTRRPHRLYTFGRRFRRRACFAGLIAAALCGATLGPRPGSAATLAGVVQLRERGDPGADLTGAMVYFTPDGGVKPPPAPVATGRIGVKLFSRSRPDPEDARLGMVQLAASLREEARSGAGVAISWLRFDHLTERGLARQNATVAVPAGPPWPPSSKCSMRS